LALEAEARDSTTREHHLQSALDELKMIISNSHYLSKSLSDLKGKIGASSSSSSSFKDASGKEDSTGEGGGDNDASKTIPIDQSASYTINNNNNNNNNKINNHSTNLHKQMKPP